MAAVVACERRERRIVDEVRVWVPYFVVSGYNECTGLLLMRKEIADASFTVRKGSDWCSILCAVDYRPKKLFPKRTRLIRKISSWSRKILQTKPKFLHPYLM